MAANGRDREQQARIDRLLRLSDRMEKPLLRTIAILLAALLLAQALLAVGSFRSRWSQIDKLEGSRTVSSAAGRFLLHRPGSCDILREA